MAALKHALGWLKAHGGVIQLHIIATYLLCMLTCLNQARDNAHAGLNPSRNCSMHLCTQPIWQMLMLAANLTQLNVLHPLQMYEALQEELVPLGVQFSTDDDPAKFKYPLQVAKFSQVVYDLNQCSASPAAGSSLLDVLKEHGFDPAVKTVWMWEGITYYLAGRYS